MELKAGTKLEKEWDVTDARTASACGSGSLPVFGTPFLVMLFEITACELIRNGLDQGTTTVGTGLDIQHTAASPIGMKVWASAELIEVDGRALTFAVEARDEAGKIGGGTHTRFIVDAERFLQKAKDRLAQ